MTVATLAQRDHEIDEQRTARYRLGRRLPQLASVVTGEFDLVAIVRVPAHDDLAKVIPGGIARVDGVARTESLIAFQVYSKHDLERMFSIGFDEG